MVHITYQKQTKIDVFQIIIDLSTTNYRSVMGRKVKHNLILFKLKS